MQSIRTTKIKKRVELPLFDRVVLALLFVFLLTDILNGAIRYYSAHFGLPWLPYLPHLLVFLALFPMFFLYLADEGLSSTFVIIVLLFGVAAVNGLFNTGNASQVEFGLWVLSSFLFGIVALPSIIRSWRKLTPYAVLLWVIAVAGVLINFFYTWPWMGFEYQVGATSIQASRMWRIGGLNFDRLAGFSTGSYFAAPQILILAVFLRETLPRKFWLPAWAISAVAIILTTSKTTIAIFLLLSIMHLFDRGSIRRLWRLIPFAAAGLDILFPFSMLFIRLEWLDSTHSTAMHIMLWSFFDRLQITWPEWIRMSIDRGNALLGRGLGGIGAAQQYFQPALANPGDNIAVYLFGVFGVLGLIALLVYGWKASHQRVETPSGRFFFSCACIVLLGGMTTSILEGVFTGMVLGASIRYVQGRTVGVRPRAKSSLQRGAAPRSLGQSPAQG